MPTLLHIDSSPFPGASSFSRQLTAEFVRGWQETQPAGTVIELTFSELVPVLRTLIVATSSTTLFGGCVITPVVGSVLVFGGWI